MSIFRNREALEHSFIPQKLPMREDIRRELVGLIKQFLKSSSGAYKGIHIYGSYGVGKTVLSKRVVLDLKEDFKDMITAYVNCRFSRRVYRVLSDIVAQISPELPKRGLSRDEFLELIFIAAREKGNKLVIILDEVDSLFWGKEGERASDFLYSLSRYIENHNIVDFNLVVISISRDQTFLYQWLDDAARASFVHDIRRLRNYTAKDLSVILSYRAELALIDGAISEDNIVFLANFVANQAHGNARVAIDILRKAAEIAEVRGDTYIKPEYLRSAMKEYAFIPRLDEEKLQGLGKQKLLLLLAIVRALKSTNKSFVTRREVYRFYRETCEEYGESPRRSTQMWRYLKEIHYELSPVLEVYVTGKNQRGRSTRISITVPIEPLERIIGNVLSEISG